jgi:small subunit ribosomal protein S6
MADSGCLVGRSGTATLPPLPATPRGAAPGRRTERWGRLRPKEGDRDRVTEYEVLLLLDPELSDEKQAEIVERAKTLLEKGGGTLERHDPWGRRKLAYPIDKKDDGIYHLLTISATPETLDELSRVLKIDDDVLRHMATRRPEGGPAEPVAAGVAIGDDAPAQPVDAPEEE